MTPITWTCHVCGDERPDALIGVFSRDRLLAGRFPVKENVRHCLDRDRCVAGASDVRFLPESADG